MLQPRQLGLPPIPRTLTHATSTRTRPPQQQYDWHLFLTIEERQAIRQKIRQAYESSCTNFEELLETVVAIEEELLHISAPSRLDYLKSGCQVTFAAIRRFARNPTCRADICLTPLFVQFEKRVGEKRKQMSGHLALDDEAEGKGNTKKQKL